MTTRPKTLVEIAGARRAATDLAKAVLVPVDAQCDIPAAGMAAAGSFCRHEPDDPWRQCGHVLCQQNKQDSHTRARPFAVPRQVAGYPVGEPE